MVCVWPWQTVQAQTTLEPLPYYARIARSFAGTFPKKHVSSHPLDDTISSLTWTNYLALLDPDHEYFLESDVEKFRTHEKDLDDELKNGDLSFAYEVFGTLTQRVRERYKRYKDGAQFLDAVNSVDTEMVLQRYLTAFAHAYDPYSEYLSQSIPDDLTSPQSSYFVGIGATVSVRNGSPEIAEITPGGPADCDARGIRLQPGDRIIAVAQGDGPPERTLHKPIYQVIRLIRGKKGTKVTLTVVEPAAAAKPRQVDLTRDEINIEKGKIVSETRPIIKENGVAGQIGIIRIPILYGYCDDASGDYWKRQESSADDVAGILNQMRAASVDGVLLDLRCNGGGSVPEAVRVAGLFITAGPVGQIATVRGIEVLDDPDPGISCIGPVVVLVNRLTASAAESVAAALQDHGRAVIVGDSRTYGKGICQTTYRLGRDPRFGSIKVTNIAYYRPNGEPLQSRGVSSDIVVPSVYDLDRGPDGYSSIVQNVPPAAKAEYEPVTDLGSIIPRLRGRSEERRADARSHAPGGEKSIETGENDPVFGEGIAILRDLIAIQQKEHLQFYREPPRKSLRQTITGWLLFR